jgi:hypothetical protein
MVRPAWLAIKPVSYEPASTAVSQVTLKVYSFTQGQSQQFFPILCYNISMDDLREKLLGLADCGYRSFSEKLNPGIANIIGIRAPELKRSQKR